VQKCLELLNYVLDRASVKEHKVEDFGAFANVFIPLGESATWRLCLHRKVLEETQKAPIFNIYRFCFHEAFNLFKIVKDFMWLLHVVLVAGLEDTLFTLLVVEKAQLDLDIHRILKLFDALLHRAEVAREVILGLLLNEGENNRQLNEEIVDCMQNQMER